MRRLRPSVRPDLEGKRPRTKVQGAKRPRVWGETSRGRNFQGAKRPHVRGESSRGESSRGRIVQGAKRPGGETSRQGAKRLGGETARGRNVHKSKYLIFIVLRLLSELDVGKIFLIPPKLTVYRHFGGHR